MKKAIGTLVKTVVKENEKDDGKMVDLEDPDKYIYKEEDMIKYVRVTREEERKKKEIEIALKIKNDKELQEKLAEQIRKQKEYEKKNVTADCFGNVIQIKSYHGDRLANDFLYPRMNIKDEISKPETIQDGFKNKDKPKNVKIEDNEDKQDKSNLKKKEEKKKVRTQSDFSTPQILRLDNKQEEDKYKNMVYKEIKNSIQPAGSNFDLIVPEVGVTISEALKSKTGGKDFSKVFNKSSKYDYQAISKETSKNSFNSNLNSLKKNSIVASNNQNNELNSSLVNLPILSNTKVESRNNNNTNNSNLQASQSFNTAHGSMRISNHLTKNLKSTLDFLDLLPNYNEYEKPLNNIDIFKKRKTYLQEKNEMEKKNLDGDLDSINKFNLKILSNERWGSNYNDTSNDKEGIAKIPSKAYKKNIDKEVGINIMMKKLPRSRVSNSMTKI